MRLANIPTDYNGQLWIHFANHDPSIYVSASDVIEGNVAPEKISRQDRADRHLCRWIERQQDDAGGAASDAWRRNPCPGDRGQSDEKALLSEPVWGSALEAAAALVLGLLVVIFAPMFGPVALVLGGGLFASL